MGMFDRNIVKKFNDAKPNYDSDGIDIIKCENTNCVYRSTDNKCLFDTCIIKNLNSVSFHTIFKTKCKICDSEYELLTEQNPPITNMFEYCVCPVCISKLKKLLGD